MPRVFIPPQFRSLADNQESVEIPGQTVRQVIDHLDSRFPGIKDKLVSGQQLRPEICVAVGSAVHSLGILAPVKESDEIHFLPIVGGG